MPTALALADHLERPLVLVDAGVRWGFAPRWAQLAPHARLIGFDADAEECRVLAERHAHLPDARFVALALGERAGTAELHVAREPGSSSLLAADEALHVVRPALAGTAPVARRTVEVDTLAAWAAREGVEHVDVLKLDVQGAELAVLRGAGALLDGARAVEVEVELNPIYRDQPLFGDVDALLRGHGFVLWRLDDLHHHLPAGTPAVATTERRRYDGLPELHARGGGGQLFWGQATYVQAATAYDAPRPPAALVLDALAAHAAGLDDLVAHLAGRLAREAGGPLAHAAAAALPSPWRGRLWRARHRRPLDAVRRLVAVRRLARRGQTPAEISASTGLSLDNVELLLRAPWRRSAG